MILEKLYSEAIFRIKNDNKVFLTFDDGPTPEVTPQVLSLLNDFNLKATFFCLGKNVEQYPQIFNSIIENGHSVGNHGYNHLNGFFTPNKSYFEDVEKASFLINSALYRPAYGKITPSQYFYLKKQFKIIFWDLLSGDYNFKNSPEKILKKLQSKTKSGSIVVFHDSLKAKHNLLHILPNYFDWLKSSGFKTGLVS